jgi:hypothetical protein
MEPVRQYNRDSAESCEQELAYNAEALRRYPYFFRPYAFSPIRLSLPDCSRLMFSRCA